LVVACGLLVGMLLEGSLDTRLPAGRARVADLAAVAVIATARFVGLRASAQATSWIRVVVADAGRNAIGVG
jgi:hypothetical protein